jgi:hypothetical protein
MYSHLHNDRFFFSGKKKLQCVPNGVEKSRTGAFRSRDQTLNIFFQAIKKRPSLCKWEYQLQGLRVIVLKGTTVPKTCKWREISSSDGKYLIRDSLIILSWLRLLRLAAESAVAAKGFTSLEHITRDFLRGSAHWRPSSRGGWEERSRDQSLWFKRVWGTKQCISVV